VSGQLTRIHVQPGDRMKPAMRAGASRVDAIRAQIQQAESTLRADEPQLGYTRVLAPMEGTVVSVDAR
jgi:macrolide-specific efflux system membrane fusion protein